MELGNSVQQLYDEIATSKQRTFPPGFTCRYWDVKGCYLLCDHINRKAYPPSSFHLLTKGYQNAIQTSVEDISLMKQQQQPPPPVLQLPSTSGERQSSKKRKRGKKGRMRSPSTSSSSHFSSSNSPPRPPEHVHDGHHVTPSGYEFCHAPPPFNPHPQNPSTDNSLPDFPLADSIQVFYKKMMQQMREQRKFSGEKPAVPCVERGGLFIELREELAALYERMGFGKNPKKSKVQSFLNDKVIPIVTDPKEGFAEEIEIEHQQLHFKVFRFRPGVPWELSEALISKYR